MGFGHLASVWAVPRLSVCWAIAAGPFPTRIRVAYIAFQTIRQYSPMFRLIFAFFSGVVATALLCSVLSTQFVIAALQDIEVMIPMAVRLQMTVKDLAILQALVPAISACFLVGFIVAALCVRWIGGHRTLWYVLAGISALLSFYMLLNLILELMPIAGARTTAGMVAQGLAGGVGGWIFASISSVEPKESGHA